MAIVLSIEGKVSKSVSVRQCRTCDQSALEVAKLLVASAAQPKKLKSIIGRNVP
jgi:hypothetical protein